jgi:microcompartment protein CcmL/EutN
MPARVRRPAAKAEAKTEARLPESRDPSTRVPAGPALALLELDSIARGYVVADALLKRAPARIVFAEATTPGKYLVLFTGEVADVEESLRAGTEAAGATLIDTLYLPYAHERLLEGIGGLFVQLAGESLAIVETQTVASTLKAADAALKRAEVTLTHLHLARGVGGKGWFRLEGELHMVEAAIEAITDAVQAPLLIATELIQRPHAELRGRVI